MYKLFKKGEKYTQKECIEAINSFINQDRELIDNANIKDFEKSVEIIENTIINNLGNIKEFCIDKNTKDYTSALQDKNYNQSLLLNLSFPHMFLSFSNGSIYRQEESNRVINGIFISQETPGVITVISVGTDIKVIKIYFSGEIFHFDNFNMENRKKDKDEKYFFMFLAFTVIEFLVCLRYKGGEAYC